MTTLQFFTGMSTDTLLIVRKQLYNDIIFVHMPSKIKYAAWQAMKDIDAILEYRKESGEDQSWLS